MKTFFGEMLGMQKLFPTLFAIGVYLTQHRLGMTIVAYLLTDFLLKERVYFTWKWGVDLLIAVLLFIIGGKLSSSLGLFVVVPHGQFAYTFPSGFLGGAVELESYFLMTIFPMKVWLNKNCPVSVRYWLKLAAIFFPIAGLVQGTYMAGWQNVYI